MNTDAGASHADRAFELTDIPDLERSVHAELVDLCGACRAAEQELLERYHRVRDDAEQKRDNAVGAIESEFEQVTSEARAVHENAMRRRRERFDQEFKTAASRYEEAQENVRNKAAENLETAQKRMQEQVWVAETVYEATEDQPREQFDEANKILDAKQEEIDALEREMASLAREFRAPTPPTAAPASLSDTTRKTVTKALANALRSGHDRVEAATNRRARKLFRLPILLSLLVVAAALGAAAAGGVEGFTPGPHLGIGAGVGFGVGVIIFAIVYITVRNALARDAEALADEVAIARACAEAERGHLVRRREEDEARARAAKDADVRKAKTTYEPILREIDERRTSKLAALAEKYEAILDDIKSTYEKERRATIEAYESTLAERTRTRNEARAAVEAECNETLEANEKQHREAWTTLEERWHAGMERAVRLSSQMDARTSALFRPWSSDRWADWRPPRGFTPIIRIGAFDVKLADLADGPPEHEKLRRDWPDTLEMPAVLRFPDQWSVLLQSEQQGRDEALAALQMMMLRILTTLPPGKARFTLFDPVGLGQNFAGFMHLADYEEAFVADKIWTESRHLEQRLLDLTEHMENVIQKYLRNDFETIAEYNEQAGEIAEPYRFLVIADFPQNFTETAARRLASVVNSGAKCGVYTLIHHDLRQKAPPGVEIEDVEQRSVRLLFRDDRFTWMEDGFESMPLTLDAAPEESFLTSTLKRIGEAAIDLNRVEVPFHFVAPQHESELWSRHSTRELRVPLGRAGATKLQNLVLGPGTSQHALIAGKTGSGKSTLLHVLITNLSLWYSPEEVEFYLVDFKKGVEFKTYAVNDLPHARAVAIESDREFGLSVLQRLDEELKIRGERFRALGVQGIAGYREIPDQPPMPRTLLIVDEFQELFVEDDKLSQDASLLLDRLVRQGRAFGMHVLLGSQTLGGAYSLARTTMGQMTVRIALQCSEADSYLILNEDNAAARLLARPGEAIYNDQSGMVEGNSPFQIVWLDDREREQALKRAHDYADEQGFRRSEPLIAFEGSAPALVSQNLRLQEALSSPSWSQRPPLTTLWIGDAVSIKDPTAMQFRRQSGSNGLIVGQNEDAALSMITAALLSAAAQHAPGPAADPMSGARFYLFNGAPAESIYVDYLDQFEDRLPQFVQPVGWRDIPNAMTELAAELERRRAGDLTDEPAIYVFVYGLQRFRDLRRDEDDFGFSMSDDDAPPKPAKQFAELFRDGPTFGMHVVCWCDTAGNLMRTIDRPALREFEHRVLFQMSSTDSTNLIDNAMASRLGMHRAIYFNEERGSIEKFRPYATPTREGLGELLSGALVSGG